MIIEGESEMSQIEREEKKRRLGWKKEAKKLPESCQQEARLSGKEKDEFQEIRTRSRREREPPSEPKSANFG